MAVVYTLTIEYGMAMVPAVINQLIVNYRLRSLFTQWTGWEAVQDLNAAVTEPSPDYIHIAALATMTIVLLAAALTLFKFIEFPTQQDG